MNFQSMEYFVALARERSFTGAARCLHMTQQSLSAHIAGMERELGCQLVIRNVPLELTYAGEVMLRYAKSFCRDKEEMLQEFCDISGNQKGVLKIGISPTRGRVIMPTIIRAFQESFPNIHIELAEAPNDMLFDKLLNRETDLIIANNIPGTVQDIDIRAFYSEEIVLLIPRELLKRVYGDASAGILKQLRKGDFTTLSGFPFVVRSEEDISGRIGHYFLEKFRIERPVIRIFSAYIETLLSACSLGIGACFCGERIARAVLTPDQFSSLHVFHLGEEAKYGMYFGYRKGGYQWSVKKAFMDIASSPDVLASFSGNT